MCLSSWLAHPAAAVLSKLLDSQTGPGQPQRLAAGACTSQALSEVVQRAALLVAKASSISKELSKLMSPCKGALVVVVVVVQGAQAVINGSWRLI